MQIKVLRKDDDEVLTTFEVDDTIVESILELDEAEKLEELTNLVLEYFPEVEDELELSEWYCLIEADEWSGDEEDYSEEWEARIVDDPFGEEDSFDDEEDY